MGRILKREILRDEGLHLGEREGEAKITASLLVFIQPLYKCPLWSFKRLFCAPNEFTASASTAWEMGRVTNTRAEWRRPKKPAVSQRSKQKTLGQVREGKVQRTKEPMGRKGREVKVSSYCKPSKGLCPQEGGNAMAAWWCEGGGGIIASNQ